MAQGASAQVYCIDSTEVTRAQYQAFLDTTPSTAEQTQECLTNTDFTPEPSPCPGCPCYDPNGPFDPVGKPDVPVTCVDWCDATAFCKWAGKHLCGRIGGGSADPTKFADANESEWFSACSKGGELAYPYGNAYDSAACKTNLGGPPLPSTIGPACVGGFPGLHDMAGNVGEWENGCAQDDCPLRGGSIAQGITGTRCDAGGLVPRSTTDGDNGFRCCADAGGGS